MIAIVREERVKHAADDASAHERWRHEEMLRLPAGDPALLLDEDEADVQRT